MRYIISMDKIHRELARSMYDSLRSQLEETDDRDSMIQDFAAGMSWDPLYKGKKIDPEMIAHELDKLMQ